MSAFSIRLARPEDAEAFHRVEDDAAALLLEAPSLEGIPIPPTASARASRSRTMAIISWSSTRPPASMVALAR